MKCRVIVEVDGADTSGQDVDHADGHDFAVDEILLVK